MAHPNRLEDRVRLLEMADALPLELVRIPGGTFLMGSPEDEPGRWDSEGPPHAVTVPSFLMGRYPVTQAQWRAVAELPLGKRSLDPDPAYFKGADRPVELVSWDEAVEFCDRLAQQTKRPYRLPTEGAALHSLCGDGGDLTGSRGPDGAGLRRCEKSPSQGTEAFRRER